MTPGVAHTIVNPGFFAENYLVTIGLAAHLGVFPWMYGNSRKAPPSNEDIARVALALTDPARHTGKSYRPTGPELLGAEEMAKAIRSSRSLPCLKAGSQHRRLKQEKNPWSNSIETCREKASSNVAAQLD